MSNQCGVLANDDDDKGLFIPEAKVVQSDEDSETESDKDDPNYTESESENDEYISADEIMQLNHEALRRSIKK